MRFFSKAVATCAVALMAAGVLEAQSGTAKMTDEDYDKIMKQVGPAFGTMRKSVEGQMMADASKDAQKLAMLFKDVEAFWTARKVSDAAEWGRAAMTHAQNLNKALVANDAAKVGEEMKMLGGMCQTCHGKYRDKAPDGTFRMKPAGN